MPRGHADLLRWEQAHGLDQPVHAADDQAQDPPLTLDALDALVLAERPALRVGPADNPLDRTARDRAIAALLGQARAAWVEAVAARAQRRLVEQMVEAADLAAELARRQHAVGHFSTEQRLRHERTHTEVVETLVAARAAEQQALARLWQQVGGADDPAALGRRLPAALPPLPALPSADEVAIRQRARHPAWAQLQVQRARARAALTEDDWQTLQDTWHRMVAEAIQRPDAPAPRVHWRQPAWPHAWEAALTAEAQWQALQRQLDADRWQAQHAAHDLRQRAQALRQNGLAQMRQLEEETLLRYNGMLASPWDLLDAVRQRLGAQHRVVGAERDAWLAALALDAVTWGLPWRGPSPATEPATAPAEKGH
ncbi:TolC family protein [Tepidimonas charontis]|uniref:Outer membrane efflux protein n=1 Tax=Tepidimonas charontis TaxID=2267262 RepID=A0A554XBM9_9BURK|nr:TolC family protein [Tepidimonas charontis]TSE33247.1 hypothetical protein Tchar_01836 [Tepidimonas charontis]